MPAYYRNHSFTSSNEDRLLIIISPLVGRATQVIMVLTLAVLFSFQGYTQVEIPPTAEDDTAETFAGQSVDIDLVENDTGAVNLVGVVIDPLDLDSIEIVQNGAFVADFDGLNDSITWTNLGLNGASAISKFIRFKTIDASAVLCDTDFSSTDNGLFISGDFLKARIAFTTAGTRTIEIVSDTIAADGNWHTAGYTYDGTILQTYFDGAPQGALAIAGDTIRHNFVSMCGKRVNGSGFLFTGQMSNFAVYDTAISAADASNYHDNVIRISGLILLGRMNESSFAGGVTDSSGNGNDGMANGATAVQDSDTPEAPLSGDLVVNGDGTVTYTPALGFSGTDSFEYTIKSDVLDLESNEAVVTVSVFAPGESRIMFATTGHGDGSGSVLLRIDPNTGKGTEIGPTGVNAIPGLAINSEGQLFGFGIDADASGDLHIIDSETGEAVFALTTGLTNADALAFDSNDVLWGVEGSTNNLVTIDTTTGTPAVVGNTGVHIAGLAFDPIDGTLYGSSGGAVIGDGPNELSIYTINTATGAATRVGLNNNHILRHQLGRTIPDIRFNEQGKFYATIGGQSTASTSKLILIDKNTFEGALIGDIGTESVSGLASRINPDDPVAVDDSDTTTVGVSVTTNVVSNDLGGSGSVVSSSVALQTTANTFVPDFDGINDRIIWGNLGISNAPITSKFIQFKTNDTNGILFDVEFGLLSDCGLYLANGFLRARVRFTSSGTKTIAIVPTSTASDGEWHSAGFTYDGTTLRTYFDGTAQGSLAVSGDTIPHNFISICGKRVSSSGSFFSGNLANFVVYNHVLSPAEIQAYHGGTIRFCDLLLWGRMNENSYTNGLVDLSGNGHVGVASGATPVFDSSLVATLSGSVTNNSDGTMTYTPLDCFEGTDSYHYTFQNSDGDISNTATVAITVAQPSL